MKILGYEFNFKGINNKSQSNESKVVDDNKSTNAIPFKQTLYRIRQDIGTWNEALLQAESVLYPNRTELLRVFKTIEIDAHLTSLIKTRKFSITGRKFKVVDKRGNEVEDKSKILNKKWFYDFVDLSLDSIYYGHSLIQFNDIINDEFKSVELVPRENVRPEKHLIIKNFSDQIGIDYTDPSEPCFPWLLSIGDKFDLGLLAKAAPLILWKKNAIAAWSEYSELFGTPIRIGKTNVRDEVTRKNMENFLKNMGNSAYGVFDTNDIIEIVDGRSASGEEIFNKLIDRCNNELSKLILGATGVVDEKSFVGAAKVHERILKMYIDSDKRFIENVFTSQLVPLLNGKGFGFENLSIVVEDESELSITERAKIDMELLKYYDLPADYITKTYGTPVMKRLNNISNIINKNDLNLNEYYGDV